MFHVPGARATSSVAEIEEIVRFSPKRGRRCLARLTILRCRRRFFRGPRWSIIRTPCKWSYSCWIAMASRPSASSSNQLPFAVLRPDAHLLAPARSPRARSGKLRHPSSEVTCALGRQDLRVHEDAEIARLAVRRAVHDENLPRRRRPASPRARQPGAAYMVSAMSSMSWRSSAVIASTFLPGSRSRGSG